MGLRFGLCRSGDSVFTGQLNRQSMVEKRNVAGSAQYGAGYAHGRQFNT